MGTGLVIDAATVAVIVAVWKLAERFFDRKKGSNGHEAIILQFNDRLEHSRREIKEHVDDRLQMYSERVGNTVVERMGDILSPLRQEVSDLRRELEHYERRERGSGT